ncbi:MAG: hypothetical protein Q8O89_08450, partial [Nanoarchaeota archaeon]|nr:hypothetical protein [Nanoarchaeota archaeon]
MTVENIGYARSRWTIAHLSEKQNRSQENVKNALHETNLFPEEHIKPLEQCMTGGQIDSFSAAIKEADHTQWIHVQSLLFDGKDYKKNSELFNSFIITNRYETQGKFFRGIEIQGMNILMNLLCKLVYNQNKDAENRLVNAWKEREVWNPLSEAYNNDDDGSYLRNVISVPYTL